MMCRLRPRIMDLFMASLVFALQTFIEAENQTSNDTECILTDIKSHLSIASQIIDTAKEKIPDGKIDAQSGNQTLGDYECIFTDIKSHLRIASQIMKTAKQKIPQDVRQLCKEFKGNESQNINHNEQPLDCSDIYRTGERRDGLYNIWPQIGSFKGSLRVYCDMESNGGGWTVIQRRGDYGSPKDYFYRNWNEYKFGFGHMLKDFWIGNENLFALTNQRLYELRVNLTDWDGDSAYAIYDEFWISHEFKMYMLHVNGYSGTAGDSLKGDNLKTFGTKDINNGYWSGGNCAEHFKGAWWFHNCGLSSLNGLYYPADQRNSTDGVRWYSFKNMYRSLKDSVMKIRPIDFIDTSKRTY